MKKKIGCIVESIVMKCMISELHIKLRKPRVWGVGVAVGDFTDLFVKYVVSFWLEFWLLTINVSIRKNDIYKLTLNIMVRL